MDELDDIIEKGKVSPATAMVVFAMELKKQGEKVDELKKDVSTAQKTLITILISVIMLLLGVVINGIAK